MFRSFALLSFGLTVNSPSKRVVRLGFDSLNRLNEAVQWPTPAGFARRVAWETAARRRRSVRGLNPASVRPTPSALHFSFPRSSSSPAAAAIPAPRAAGAIADDSSSSLLLHHRNSTTVTPATPDVPHCPLFQLGKPQQRTRFCRSLPPCSVVVATPL